MIHACAILLGVVVIAGCAAPANPTPLPPRPIAVAPISTVPVVMTPIELTTLIPQRVATICPAAVATPTVSAGKPKLYDFSPVTLDATFGPTRETQPRMSFARDTESIRGAIIGETDRMAECVRVALGAGMRTGYDTSRSRLGAHVTANVELTIDPFGIVSAVKVDTPPQLAECLRTTLLATRISRMTARETRASVTIWFSSLGGVKPLKALPPRPAIMPTPGRCMRAPDPLPIDTLELATLEVDFDPPPLEGSRRNSLTKCRHPDVDKIEIRRAVNANLGDLRSCYLVALARQPALVGDVSTKFVIASHGEFTQVTVSGAGDDAFHRCLAEALALSTTFSRPAMPIIVTYPFTLTRSPVDPTASVEQATAVSAELARNAKTAAASCQARSKIVEAYVDASSFDPRALPAVESLAAFIAANNRPALAQCIADLVPTLEVLGRLPLRPRSDANTMRWWRGRGLAEAVERSLRLVKLFPELERSLLVFIGDGLKILLREDEARAAYLRFFALGSDDPNLVERAAEGYARSTRARDDLVPWDCDLPPY